MAVAGNALFHHARRSRRPGGIPWPGSSASRRARRSTCRSRPRCWRRSGRVAAGSDQARGLGAKRRLVHLAARLLGQLALAPETEVARDLVAREPDAAVGQEHFRSYGCLHYHAGGVVIAARSIWTAYTMRCDT